jgi:hypothetical protein
VTNDPGMRPRQPRYDMGPVLGISRRTGIAPRQLSRFMRLGVPFWSADRLATRLNRSPGELWPEWESGEPSPVIIDWVERRRAEAAARRVAEAAAAARRAQIRAALPPPDLDDVRSPGDFRLPRLAAPINGAHRRGTSDDLVYIFPSWLADSPNPPGLPPRKEEASCACSTTDDLGRHPLGWCGPNCERRPA